VCEPEDSDESDGGVKKPAGKGKRTTGSKSIGVMQTTKAADTPAATEEKTQIIEQCWCNLQHRGHRHLKGCAKRYGKKDGVYVRYPEYAGYNPTELAAIVKVQSSKGAHHVMEKAPDGEYKALSVENKVALWTKVMEAKKADVSEGLRLLNLCEMVKVAIPEESGPANRANDQVEAERSTDGSGTEPEESDDSSEESEDDIPVYQMMTTMFHVGNDKEEDETAHVTMWKVRIFQEGNNLLGTGSDPTDYGRTVMVFPDSGADAPGANADYVEAVGLAKVPRPRDKWFRIDGAVEGQTSLITIKEDVLLDVYFEGQEYLGTDSKRITSKGDGRWG
jgi:hypothetical protein